MFFIFLLQHLKLTSTLRWPFVYRRTLPFPFCAPVPFSSFLFYFAFSFSSPFGLCFSLFLGVFPTDLLTNCRHGQCAIRIDIRIRIRTVESHHCIQRNSREVILNARHLAHFPVALLRNPIAFKLLANQSLGKSFAFFGPPYCDGDDEHDNGARRFRRFHFAPFHCPSAACIVRSWSCFGPGPRTFLRTAVWTQEPRPRLAANRCANFYNALRLAVAASVCQLEYIIANRYLS